MSLPFKKKRAVFDSGDYFTCIYKLKLVYSFLFLNFNYLVFVTLALIMNHISLLIKLFQVIYTSLSITYIRDSQI